MPTPTYSIQFATCKSYLSLSYNIHTLLHHMKQQWVHWYLFNYSFLTIKFSEQSLTAKQVLANHKLHKRKGYNFLPTNTDFAWLDIRLFVRLGIPGCLVDARQTESTMLFPPFLEEAHYTPDRLDIKIILIML